MILNDGGRSKWEIIGVGMGKRPNLGDKEPDWLLIKDYKIKLLNGTDILKEGDLLYLD
jgi:hypothetical protein